MTAASGSSGEQSVPTGPAHAGVEVPGSRTLLDRRRFLGLGVLAAGGAVLAACSSSTPSAAKASSGGSSSTVVKKQTGPLVVAGPVDNTGTTTKIIDQWNAANPDTPVTFQTLPDVTNDVYSQYVTALAGGASTPDILTMDVTYPGTFASAGWILPLDPYLDSSITSAYSSTVLDIGKYNGKIYSLPDYIDVGQLYYRTDLLEKYGESVPETFDQLVATAQKIQAAERKTNPNFYGFVWEGAKIEAITDEFCEYVWGYGGEISKGSKVTLDTSAGKQGLQFMYDTVYTYKISPPGESTMLPNDALVVMQDGNALFMRNWVYAYALLENAGQSKVVGKVANAPFPGATAGGGHGCIGGWEYGINAKSARPEAAWRFIEYVTAKPQQLALSMGTGTLSGRTDVQTDPTVLAKSPNLKVMPRLLAAAKSRPSIKNYPEVSTTIQAPLNSVIAGQGSVSSALATAQAAVANAVVS